MLLEITYQEEKLLDEDDLKLLHTLQTEQPNHSHVNAPRNSP
jgi:hypothetical protein